MRVLSEHPSELVRDQYLMQVADTLRLEPRVLRSTLLELQSQPAQREVPNEPMDPSQFSSSTRRLSMPRPGLEALRLILQAPTVAGDRFIAQYFIDETQRDVFESLASGRSVADVVVDFERRGDDEAVRVISQLVVDETEHGYSSSDVTAVVAQLLRSAVGEELKNIERQLRANTIAPDVAMATIRDVKERLALLDTPHGDVAESDLRTWLLERASSAAP